LTTANVAPSPSERHAWTNTAPTKIPTGTTSGPPGAGTVTVPIGPDSAHSRKPSVEASPNAVSARREPTRSAMSPPGYGYSAASRLLRLPKSPITTAPAPRTLR
jgi:hypothetical protein